jgi:hypothetical protein
MKVRYLISGIIVLASASAFHAWSPYSTVKNTTFSPGEHLVCQ